MSPGLAPFGTNLAVTTHESWLLALCMDSWAVLKRLSLWLGQWAAEGWVIDEWALVGSGCVEGHWGSLRKKPSGRSWLW